MSEYEKQAQDFLESTGTTLTVEYQYTGPYFPGEKGSRDVYQFTLRNASGEYSARFGDSTHNTERRAFARRGPYDLTSREAKRLGLTTFAKLKEARNHKPSAYDILACLSGHEPGTFRDFCDNYGYDTDSIKALEVYKAVQTEWEGVCRLFTAEQLEQLAEVN